MKLFYLINNIEAHGIGHRRKDRYDNLHRDYQDDTYKDDLKETDEVGEHEGEDGCDHGTDVVDEDGVEDDDDGGHVDDAVVFGV